MPVGTVYTIREWNDQISFNGRLATESCPTCHIVFGFPEEMQRRALEYNLADHPRDHDTVYCPNGHPWSYTGDNSALQRAKRRAEKAEQALQWTQDRLNATKAERDHAEAKARGYKGALVKTQKRVAAGVCPYCNRTFTGSRIARHIATQHPGIDP